MITRHDKVRLAKERVAKWSSKADMKSVNTFPSVEQLDKVCKDGRLDEAISAFEMLDSERVPVSMDLLLHLMQRCSKQKDLAAARRLQLVMVGRRLDLSTLLQDHLIRLFASCGSLVEANQVFCKIPKPSIYTWNAIISAHAKLGGDERAIELYHKMQGEGQKPDKYLLSCILKVCSHIGAVGQGRLVHHQISSSELLSDLVVGNALVFMYAKCGSIEEARSVFDSLQKRNVATWSALIAGYSQCGCGTLALELFQKMQDEGIQADKVLFLCALKACSSTGALRQGMLIHNQVVVYKLECDVVVASTLVDMYAKCWNLQEACRVFGNLRNRDSVSWSAMIAGCVECRNDHSALELFLKMQQEGINPNNFTFSCTLKACGNAGALEQGRIVHDLIVRTDLKLDVIVENTLIDMYAKCGRLDEAHRVFDRLTIRSIISWGTIIGAYAEHGHGDTTLQIFENLQQANVMPDKVIFLSVVKACGSTGDILLGRTIHAKTIKSGFSLDVVVGNTLVDMYAKCRSMEEARKVFDALPDRNLVSWSAMIAGYAHQNQWVMALELFEKVQQEDIMLDKVTFLCALKACGSLGAVGQGKLIHDQIIRLGFESDTVIGSALLDSYCNCGYLNEGHHVFDRLPDKDMVTWGAMIAGLVHCGSWTLARKCLLEMGQQGITPNEEIFSCFLIACSCAGLLEEGQWYFNCMREDHGISPNIDHYGCMVDLLGRAGLLKEADDLVQTMPNAPNVIAWTSLLTSCKTYSNIEIGSHCFNEFIQANPADASGYVLMSDIYAGSHVVQDIENGSEHRHFEGAFQ